MGKMKVIVTLSERGYRSGFIEIDVGDQPTELDAEDAACSLAEDIDMSDSRITWGEWSPSVGYPDLKSIWPVTVVTL